MNGFRPKGLRPIRDLLSDMEFEELGAALASGEIEAVYQYYDGRILTVAPAQWGTHEGRDMLRYGTMPASGGGYSRGLPIYQKEPVKAARPPDIAKTGLPDWWPAEDERFTTWIQSAHATKAAERAAGPHFSETAKCRAFEFVWRLAGRDIAEGTAARTFREIRDKKNR